jgi:2-aminoethylphosphonate-pyruvate transaminase
LDAKIRKAVILAAGMGERLINVMSDKPKGFIQFGEKSIIEESIDKLLYFGIEDIVIVTGYLSHFYEDLIDRYSFIETVTNQKYAVSGSMYSLYCARGLIGEDFLLLESDLIYEPKALKELLNIPERDAILVSGYTNAGDEVFVETRNNNLINMSKEKGRLNNIAGELVGISKVSFGLYKEMIALCQKEFQSNLMLDYETDGFVRAAKVRDIYCHTIEELAWCEIDDQRHYDNAKERIYPMIITSEVGEK